MAKKNIHPETHNVMAHCTCGNELRTTSTLKEIRATLCSKCHPFFTGEQRYVDTANRIEKFNRKYKDKK